jgi:hypothetical protein
MIDEIYKALSLQLPLRIDEVDYNDPMVVLAGPGWSLSVACPWRLMQDCQLETSYGDDGAAAVLGRLVGRDVVAAGSGDSARGHGDIQIALDDGTVLEVLADTDLDPWVLRLRHHTFVGTASCA